MPINIEFFDFMVTRTAIQTRNCGIVPVLNEAPRYEVVLGEWGYSSTHSLISAPDGGE
jgi:RNAse (barnase) inhibitor barstar